MVAVARDQDKEELIPINLRCMPQDVELAGVIAKRRTKIGSRTPRSDIMRQALRRGLLAMAEEEGIKAQR